jgi:hypothetical protein
VGAERWHDLAENQLLHGVEFQVSAAHELAHHLLP